MAQDPTAQAEKAAEETAEKKVEKMTDKTAGTSSPKRSKYMLKFLKKPPKLLVLGSVLLLGGGAIAYLNFAQRAPKSLLPTGPQLIPQTALATVSVTTDELTWTKLRQFGTAETQPQFDNLLREWKDRLFTANGYSFRRDIKPWIGDRVTLAILNDSTVTSRNSPNASLGGIESALQNLVLVVPIKDPLKAKALLGEGPKNAAIKWSERTYKGITITTVKAKDSAAIESAVIGTEWLLLSNQKTGIEQAIDTYKGGRSLLDLTGYRKAATRIESPQPPGKNFAQIYLNIPAVTQAIEPATGNAANSSIVPLQGSQGIVATALIESEGLRFQGTSWLSPKNDLAYSNLTNEAGEMPRRLPDDTLVMISGGNLQRFWQGFSEGNSSPPFFPNPQNLKAGLLTQTGLDLDEDVMPWAAGEFALGVLPPNQAQIDQAKTKADSQASTDQAASTPSTSADPENPSATANEPPVIESAPLIMMVQTNDRKTAESVWAQLDDVMASRYRYKVETQEFEGGSSTTWTSPFQGVQFSHGWLPGNVVFFGVGLSGVEAISPNPDKPLAANRLFQTLTNQAPEPNNGHFYLDLARINDLDGGAFPLPKLPEEGATTAIQAIGMTATVGDGNVTPQTSRTLNYDLYVKLSKAAKPGPL